MADEVREDTDVENPESVFPLPLTPIEKFFFWDDRQEQPLTSFFDLRFESSIDVGVFEACVQKVLDRNPLLRANITGDDSDLKWTLSDKTVRLLNLATDLPIVDGRIRPIDLRTEIACRFWYETTPDCSRVLIQLHHAACDGIAFRSVLIDIFHSYALATDGSSEDSQGHRMLSDRFRFTQLRDRFDFTHLGDPKKVLSTWQRIKNAWYFHFQPPAPLAKSTSTERVKEEQGGSSYPLCNLMLDRDFSQRILQICQSKEYGVNDLAIAILFRTCYQWNRRHGDRQKKGRLRILMPYDLRGRTDLRMPACNRLSLSFLGRDYSQCDDLNELISTVHDELKDAKDTHLYLDLLNGFQIGCSWPRFMKWAVEKHNSMATVAITYAGDVSRGMSKLFPEVNELRRIGTASLFSIMAAPPARRNTNLSMALCINWGRICISAIWNRSVFNEQDCREFLELYKIGWQDWCAAEESRVGVYAEPEAV